MGKIRIGLVCLIVGIIGYTGASKLASSRYTKYEESKTTVPYKNWYMKDLFCEGNPMDESALALLSMGSSLVGLGAIVLGTYQKIRKKSRPQKQE